MSRRKGARRNFVFGPIAPIAAFWRCSHIGEMSVFVVPYNPDWEIAFGREAKAIRGSLPDLPIVLHHIGSTAIPGILAKPIIDMLGAVDHLEGLDQRSARIADLGYEVMGPFGIEGRRYFRKFDATGRRTHHLHVFANGFRHIERHLAFRDYLRSNPLKAAEYSELKAKITSGQAGSWDDYMDTKGPFIAKTEEAAVAWYRLRRERG
jgi:GrpB-like predicted nucleotidyltransferase (UPF0157 family)